MINRNGLIKHLRGIVADFEEQGPHFEFNKSDAIAVRNAADVLERKNLKRNIYILTETNDGELYLLEADDFNELVNEYRGEHSLGPTLDAKVYFASYAGKPINPYAYSDFASCVAHIRTLTFER